MNTEQNYVEGATLPNSSPQSAKNGQNLPASPDDRSQSVPANLPLGREAAIQLARLALCVSEYMDHTNVTPALTEMVNAWALGHYVDLAELSNKYKLRSVMDLLAFLTQLRELNTGLTDALEYEDGPDLEEFLTEKGVSRG